jgi:hypothetical protein
MFASLIVALPKQASCFRVLQIGYSVVHYTTENWKNRGLQTPCTPKNSFLEFLSLKADN